ncbi:MAG: phage holin family protein [Pseudomonadota bacterium]
MRMDPIDGRARGDSAGSLIADLLTSVPDLFRKEMALLRSEIGDKTEQAVTAVGMIVGAVVFALVALNVLAAALVVALTNAGLSGGWSALIVGGVIAALAVALGLKGMNDLKASRLAPSRTAENLKRDAQAMKEAVR